MERKVKTLKIILVALIAVFTAVECIFDLIRIDIHLDIQYFLPGPSGDISLNVKAYGVLAIFAALVAVAEIALAVKPKSPSVLAIVICCIRTIGVIALMLLCIAPEAELCPASFACAALGLAALVVYSLLRKATASPSQLISKESEQQ